MIDEEAEAFRENIRQYDTTPLEEINSDGNGRISWVSPPAQAASVTVGLFSMGADCFTIDE